MIDTAEQYQRAQEAQAWRDTIICTRTASHDTLAHLIVHSAEGAQG